MSSPSPNEILDRLPSPGDRRASLREHMHRLAADGKTCQSCCGVCCTFVSNSMRITPVEAMDLKRRLESEGRWTPELLETLRDTVRSFRLDQDAGDGRRSLRKTYTCPFYTPGPRGCSIHPDHKPYGCLAFNARAPGITEGGNCASARDQLLDREAAFPEEETANQALRERFALDRDTEPIPIALLKLESAE